MAFPTNSTVLDDFNRANQGTATGWTNLLNSFQVISNQAGNNGVGSFLSYFSTGTPGPDVEAYMTVVVRPPAGGSCTIIARMQDVGSFATLDAYYTAYDRTANNMNISRIDNGVGTILGSSISQTMSDGDAMGIECIGTSISAYYKAAAGSWTNVGTRTDATYGSAGRVGMSATSDTTNRVDDFSGGTYIPPAPTYAQVTFRVRNDDGSETTATWRQTQGTDDAIASETAFRLRFLIQTTNDAPSQGYKLQFRKVGTAGWRDVTS